MLPRPLPFEANTGNRPGNTYAPKSPAVGNVQCCCIDASEDAVGVDGQVCLSASSASHVVAQIVIRSQEAFQGREVVNVAIRKANTAMY
jgi:hypothetical protein